MLNTRLKQLRSEYNITQTTLAEALGIAKTTLAAYEQGKSEPNIDMLIKLANYFNVPIDYLTGHLNVKNVKNASINTALGLSDKAIANLIKCHSFNYDVSQFIENDIFIKLMEAYSEYILLINLPEPIESYDYGYDSFDMNDPFDVLQKNFLDHLEDMPSKEAYQVYIGSLIQKILNTTKGTP